MEDYDKKTGQGEELGESCWHAGKIWPISPGSLQDNVGMAGMDGTVKTSMRSGKTSDMVFLNELKPSDVFDYYHYTSANRLRSRPTRTMDVWRHRASNGRASPVYQPWGPWLLRGGGSVTSVPLTHHSALWPSALAGGIPYYIMPSFHLHSSVALLS